MSSELSEIESKGPMEKKMRPNDFTNYDSLVGELAGHLKLARHPDSSVTIKAARLLIENVLSSKSLADKETTDHLDKESVRETRIQQAKFDLDDISLPPKIITASKLNDKNGKKDELMETFKRASKSLKLLYLDDQKQLQNQVNEIVSSIQSLTANPKTDSKLTNTARER